MCPKLVILVTLLLIQAPAFGMGGPSPTPNGDIFESHVVPGATCGDGTPYQIYIRKGETGKVLMHFEGGGACWNNFTCFGPTPFTGLGEVPQLFKKMYLGNHIGDNPFQAYTYVYLPYCTGDMHAGSHQESYSEKHAPVRHYGRSNFTKVLEWLEQSQNKMVSTADDVVLYGDSAGALGVVMNLDQVSAVVGPQANKTALVDSPGLHFNDDIWNRFSSAYLADIDRSLEANSMKRDPNSGILAPQMRSFCAAHPDWKVGVTQSTQDIVMSAVFGKLTPIQHYFRVMGENGIHQSLWDPNDNCSSWVPDTAEHVFSVYHGGWEKETWDGVSNAQFTKDLISSRLFDPHPSHH